MSKKKERANHSRNKPPPFRELVMITTPIDKTAPCSLSLDLEPRELGSIGYVMTQWALLEHELFFATASLAERGKLLLPKEAWDLSFTKRLNAFRTIVKASTRSKSRQTRLLGLSDRIGTAEGNRHRIAHDFWTYNPKRIDQLWSMNVRRPNSRMVPFSSEKLWSLGDLFGQLAFELRFGKPRRHMLALFKTGPGYVLPPRSALLKIRVDRS